MHKIRMTLSISLCFLLGACQAGIGPSPVSTSAPASPSGVPSAMPTVGSSPGPSNSNSLVFSTDRSSVCQGETLTISLVRSNLNRGSVPIVFQYHSRFIPGSVEPTPEPDLPKDPVQLGQMQVAPTGEGEFSFTMQTSYVSRNGTTVEIKTGDFLSLYAETSPGNYERINDISLCPPIPSPDPNAPPTPQPSAPAPSQPIEPINNDFKNQEIYSIDDRIDFYTQIHLQGRKGIISWLSGDGKPFEFTGRIVEDLKAVGHLNQEAVPNHERLLPVFNDQGDGFLIWKTISSGSTIPDNTINVRPLKAFQAQQNVKVLDGFIWKGFVDSLGNGSLFSVRTSENNDPSGSLFSLWRYPVSKFQIQTTAEKVTQIPASQSFPVVDASGQGFIVWSRTRLADIDPPYDSGVIYLNNYQPTGDQFTFSNDLFGGSATEVNIQNGNGTLIIPALAYRRQYYQIFPVRDYRVYQQERHLLKLPEPLADNMYSVLKVSSDGKGILVVLDNHRELRASKVENFVLSGPTYRLQQTIGPQDGDSVLIDAPQLELNEAGDGLIVWQQTEIFRNQMVETEPGFFNSHRVTHVYMRPIRGFQSW